MGLFHDFSGGLDGAQTKIRLGLDTKRVAWSDCCNVEVYKNRGVTRQNGNVLMFKLPETEAIIGIFGYVSKGYKYVLVNTACGKFYVWDDRRKVLSLKRSDMSAAQTAVYIRYLGGVVVSNGLDDPFYFNPDASTQIKQCNAVATDGTEIRALCISVFRGRLWLADESTLYFSALGRFDDWTSDGDAGYIRNFHTDADEITAILPYKEYLAVHKRGATYFLAGNNPADFVIVNFADRGASSTHVLRNIDNKQFFYSDGVFTLEQSGQLAQIAVGNDIMLPIRKYLNELGERTLARSVMVEYRAKNQLWLFVGAENSEYLQQVWQYDLVAGAWFKRVIPQPITAACAFENKVLTATARGEVLLEDTGNSFCGAPISFMWRSPFFSLGEPNMLKTVDEFYLLLDEACDNDFELALYTEYDSELEQSVDKVVASNPEALMFDADGYFWSDDNNLGSCWTKHVEAAHRAFIWGSNTSIQLCLQGKSETSNLGLIGMEFKEVIADG